MDSEADNIIRLAAIQEQSKDKPKDSADYSEDALALRFAELHSDGLRFVSLWSRWLEWASGNWRADKKLHTMSLAREICRQAARECNE
jgi:putative DNA primase/helicase